MKEKINNFQFSQQLWQHLKEKTLDDLGWPQLLKQVQKYAWNKHIQRAIVHCPHYFDEHSILQVREKINYFLEHKELEKNFDHFPLWNIQAKNPEAPEQFFYFDIEQLISIYDFIKKSLALIRPMKTTANPWIANAVKVIDPIDSLDPVNLVQPGARDEENSSVLGNVWLQNPQPELGSNSEQKVDQQTQTQWMEIVQYLQQGLSLEEQDLKISAFPELEQVFKQKKQVTIEFQKWAQQYVSTLEPYLENKELIWQQQRCLLLVKQNKKSKVPGFIRGISGSGSSLYIEPQAFLDWNNRLLELQSRYENIYKEIIHRYSQWIQQRYFWIKKLEKSMIDIGLHWAKSAWHQKELSISIRMAQFSQYFELKQIKHPLLAEKAIGLDVYLSPEPKILVISGANTSGKTTFLKTLGISVLLNQWGMGICAEQAKMPVFDQIIFFSGDHQDLQKGLSSFSSYIHNMKAMIQFCGAKSLLLFDELGWSTNPEQGVFLTQVLLEKLQEQTKFIFLTTHFSYLYQLSLTNEQFRSACLEFSQFSQKASYQFVLDQFDHSATFAVALEQGLELAWVDRAQYLYQANQNEKEQQWEQWHQKNKEWNRQKAQWQEQVKQWQKQWQKLIGEQEQQKIKWEQQKKLLESHYEQQLQNYKEQLKVWQNKLDQQLHNDLEQIQQACYHSLANLANGHLHRASLESVFHKQSQRLSENLLKQRHRGQQKMVNEHKQFVQKQQEIKGQWSDAVSQKEFWSDFTQESLANQGHLANQDNLADQGHLANQGHPFFIPIQFKEELVKADLVKEGTLKVQQEVWVNSLKRKGIVQKILPKKKVKVLLGSISGIYALEDLSFEIKDSSDQALAKGKSVPDQQNLPSWTMERTGQAKQASLSLDLRGFYFEQAQLVIEKQIDQALLGQWPWFSIICGQGPLKNKIEKLLKENPYLDHFEYAQNHDGGAGKIYVHLKN